MKGGEDMANTWRKEKDSDAWHFCSNCTNWPTSNYDEESSEPTGGELCDECKSKKAMELVGNTQI